MQKITTFLMFNGNAEEAMKFYTSLFKQSHIISITRYGKKEAGPEGTVQQAIFSLKKQEFMCIDSSAKQGFSFTPAMSLFVNCDKEEEIDELFKKLSTGGKILMPLGSYPFSKKYGWITDKFGVSWQLNFAKKGMIE